MLSVSFNNGQVSLVENPRPGALDPTDAIVMVTTAAIGPWETCRAAGTTGEDGPTPGAQFTGTVVEIGSSVGSINLDDLVVALCAVRIDPAGPIVLFGGSPGRSGAGQEVSYGPLNGGHSEYVRVPLADSNLTRTTPAAEERTVFAGGAAALGVEAAERAIAIAGDGPVTVAGCDAAGLSAVGWVRYRMGRNKVRLFAIDAMPARSAAAKGMGAEVIPAVEFGQVGGGPVIIGADLPAESRRELFNRTTPGTTVIYTNPLHNLPDVGSGHGQIERLSWPGLEQARRVEMAIRLRQLDLTALVSTVLPLDDATEAYRLAVESPPGTRSVLLKP